MRTFLFQLTSCLAWILFLSPGYSQTPAEPKTYAEASGQGWVTNFYNQPLSSLGEILTVRITHKPAAYRDLWDVIEYSTVTDYWASGMALGIPPLFTIEYRGGLRIEADRYSGRIILPDGRKTLILLEPPSARRGRPTGVTPSDRSTNQPPSEARPRP